MTILTKKMRKFLESKDRRGYEQETQRIYEDRLVGYVVRGLEDVTFILNKLPEEKRNQILQQITERNMAQPFFEALLDVKQDADRKLILKIWGALLIWASRIGYAETLVEKKVVRAMSAAHFDSNIRAIYFGSLYTE